MRLSRAVFGALALLGLATAAPIPATVQLEARSARTQYTAPHDVIYTLTSGLPSDLGGFNRLMLAFWTTTGLVGEAANWAALAPADRTARLAAYHRQGVAVMVAAFGANDIPTAQDPAAIAGQLADYVKSYGLDGVDIDYEDTDALYGGTGAQWVSQLTSHLRAALPDKLISHAPQSPYFGAGGGYLDVDASVGDSIDFYNVQYYNQGGDQGCDASLRSGPGNVQSLLSAGIPAAKIVFGKPLQPQDGNSGWMSSTELAACLATAPAGWPHSVMFWQWSDGLAPAMLDAVNGNPPAAGTPAPAPAPSVDPPAEQAPPAEPSSQAPATPTQGGGGGGGGWGGNDGFWTPDGARPATTASTALPFWQTGRW